MVSVFPERPQILLAALPSIPSLEKAKIRDLKIVQVNGRFEQPMPH
jgi:hypothetical protein